MKIRLAEFVRFARSRNQRSRRSIVMRARSEAQVPVYNVASDFYKRAREGIQGLSRSSGNLDALDTVVERVHPKRRPHVRRVIDAYKAWADGRAVEYLPAPRGRAWAQHGVEVPVNPELSVVIDGRRHLVKVNFTQMPLAEAEVALIQELMHAVHGPASTSGCRMAVLDLANGRFYCSDRPSTLVERSLRAQAAAVAALWQEIEAEATA